MRKYIFILLLVLFCSARASAQFTLVSGTITDTSGLGYACGTISASIVNLNGQNLYLSGAPFAPQPGATKLGCPSDPNTSQTPGAFTLQLADNAQIKCGSGASIVTCATQTQWLFTVNSTGILPPLGTGPQTCAATITITGSSQTISTNFTCPKLANPVSSSGTVPGVIDVTQPQFGVKADGKVCFDGTVTNGSPNISSAGQCQWTSADIGKKIFVTNLCSAAQCGFTLGPGSITILPSTQTTVARIGTVTDATHVIADCNSPANCVSPNASTPLANTATVIYGDDDTNALNNAFASWTGTSGCPTILLPRGLMFWNSALFLTLPNLATNPCTSPNVTAVGTSKFQNLGQAIGNSALTFKGQGPSSTLFVPTPDFNYGSCVSTCFGGWLSPIFEDFGIWGGGQSLLGAGVLSGATLVVCQACIMQNVSFTQWGSRAANLGGLNLASFAYGTNVYTNSFGGGSGGVFATGDANQLSNSTVGFSSNSLTVRSGAILNTSNVIFYGPTPFNAPTVDVIGTWLSSNDRTEDGNIATSPTPAVRVENGGKATINNFFYFAGSNANSSGLSVVSGGTATVYGWRTSLTTLTSGGNIAGTLQGWGNDFGGPLTVTGTVSNAPSEQGSVTCAASTATITFHSPVTYRSNPVVLLTDNTTAGGARISAETTSTATVTCTGATDVVVYSVTPNPN